MDSIEMESLLQEGEGFCDHSDLKIENNISASCESISGRKYFRDLSPDKDFHLYVCYCEEDYVEVKPICVRLEEAFGLKCMIFKRDFPQAGLIEDMCKNALEKCEKVLIFLSPNSRNSYWCSLEIRHACMNTFTNLDDFNIILVELYPVEKPACLQGIKHINPTETEDVAASIHEAFYHPEITNELKEINRKVLAEKRLRENGTVVFSEAMQPKQGKLIIGWRSFAPVMEYHEFLRLRRKHHLGLELMNQYNAVCEVLNSHLLLRFYPVLQGTWYPWFASLNVSLLVLFLFLGSVFLSVAIHKKNNVIGSTYACGVIVSLSLFPITRIILWISKIKKYLCELLKMRNPDITDEENQTEAGSKIENLLHKVFFQGEIHKLETCLELRNTNRHNTVGFSRCLCQRLERDIIPPLIRIKA
ncbi:uncharacterized protein LOC134278914 isoform X2 [Saccostrea cucullata]|uniref:uncharacterized protein LOC134278914 isoform X2 n=1 Tax=Saccostrea cuccullata TaxID=36930 RepID=UPI002ED39FC5